MKKTVIIENTIYLFLLLLCIVIIAVSAAVSWIMISSDHSTKQQFEWNVDTNDEITSLSKSLQIEAKRQSSMKAFYIGSKFVSNKEYFLFDNVAWNLTGQSTMEWLPVVHDSVLQKMEKVYQDAMEDPTLTFENTNSSDYQFPVTYINGKMENAGEHFEKGTDYAAKTSEACRKALWETINKNETSSCVEGNDFVTFLSVIKGSLSNTTEHQTGVLKTSLNLKTIVAQSMNTRLWSIKIDIGDHKKVVSIGEMDSSIVLEKSLPIAQSVLSIYFSPKNQQDSILWLKILVLAICICVPFMLYIITTAIIKFVITHFQIRKSNIQRGKEIETAKLVANAISFLDWKHPSITRLLNSKHRTELESVLTKIIDNVQSYQPYLPTSLFVQDEQMDDVESNNEVGILTSSTISSKLKKSSIAPASSSSPSRYSSEHKVESAKTKLMLGLRKKHVTMMVLRLPYLHQISSQKVVEAIHSAYLETMVQSCSKFMGDFHSCMDDMLVFSWNGVSVRFEQESKACNAALLAQKKFSSLCREWYSKFEGIPELKLKISICTDDVLCGNIGSSTSKSFCFYGPLLDKSKKVCMLNQVMNTSILMDYDSHVASSYLFISKAVDRIRLRANGPMYRVFELLEAKNISQNEWIYEMEQSENQDSETIEHNKAWDLYSQQKLDEAKDLLDQIKPEKQDSHYAFLLKLLNGEDTNYARTAHVF